MVNAQNIFDFLEEKEEPANWYREQVKESANWHGDTAIEIDNISFCYREDKPLLQDYSMKVMKGESVAITGASGCGKTTISKLLLGLYPVEKGDIKILGKSYREYANATFREQIAYVPQEPYLFSCSIRENIRMGRPEATDAEVESAAKLAYAHDFIINLEEGYDTNVGERGNNLSGGQRQHIAIARAILKDAPILLLDEATSALDNESENYINMALKSLKNQKTIVMIAHRPSTIALADRECRIS